ncbi:MAG: disulfide bond formation protein B, partial [Gammaproteobacteria bacterium]|nr:disulfide bond formation protein B [Gammaproteobacteria bacterium]
MLNKYLNISSNKWYWIILLVLGIGLELSALFYQYVLDYPPCVLCIHVRIWVLGIIVVSLLALKLYKNNYGLLSMQGLMTILSVGLFERSYQTLGVERGFVFGDCNMESGLPAWFALDKWFPSVFEVQAACGYT